MAIEAGTLLARRLYANDTIQCDYINVPTTVFTPLEYGACGYSEADAIKKFGEENIEVYIQSFCPLEWQVPHRPVNACFAKLICLKSENVSSFVYLLFNKLFSSFNSIQGSFAWISLFGSKCGRSDSTDRTAPQNEGH